MFNRLFLVFFLLISALSARGEEPVKVDSSTLSAQELTVQLKSLEDRAQQALDGGAYPPLPDAELDSLRARWPTLPPELSRPLDPRWASVQALYDALVGLKKSGIDLRSLTPATRKLIAQGGQPGALGERLAEPGVPIQRLLKTIDDLSRRPAASDGDLRRFFDNDRAAAEQLPSILSAGRTSAPGSHDPLAPAAQLPIGFKTFSAAPPMPSLADAPVAAAANWGDYRRAVYEAIASQPLLPQALRRRATVQVSQSMSSELNAMSADDPRRPELLSSLRRFNVSACADGLMPNGTTFSGRDLGDAFSPNESATYVTMKGRPGFVLVDPNNGGHQTFESLDKRLIIEQIPQAAGRQAMITTHLDAQQRVVSRDARIVDANGVVVEGKLKPDGTLASAAEYLDGDSRRHPPLTDAKGGVFGVVLNDYKNPDFASLRRAGFLDTTFDAIHEPELRLQLSRIAGLVSAPPQLVRLPPAPGFEARGGDLALVYEAAGLRHVDRIGPAGTHYSVTDSVLDAQGRVVKIVACADEACAHQDVFLGVGVPKYDEQGRWTSQTRVKITHDGVEDAGQNLRGDTALDAHLQDARKFLEDNKWISWLPKSAGFVGDRGLDVAYGFEEFENSLLTRKGDVERVIWGDATHSQEPAMAWSKTPGTDLMRALRRDLGPDDYLRLREAMADADRKALLKTAGNPEQALSLREGTYDPSDEEIGQFVRSGQAGLGFHGIATAAAQAAAQTDSLSAKIGYHAFGAGATLTEVGAQGFAFEGVGYGLKALGSIGKAAEVVRVAPLADESAAAAQAVRTSGLAQAAQTAATLNTNLQGLYFKVTMPLDTVDSLVRAHESGDGAEWTKGLYQIAALGAMNGLHGRGQGGPAEATAEPATGLAAEHTNPVAAAEPAHSLPTSSHPLDKEMLTPGEVKDLVFLQHFEPAEFKTLLERHPAFQVYVDDAKFEGIDGLNRDALDSRIISLYPNDYYKGYDDLGAYQRRQRWRAAAGGRPIPGDPGGPRWTSVDEALGPQLPRNDGSEKRFVSGVGPDAKTYVTDGGDVNVYDAAGARLGALPYTQSGHTISVGHVFVDPAVRGQGVSNELVRQLIVNHPEATRLKTSLSEDNAFAFWKAYERTHDYDASIRETPAYKARVKQGFSVILPPPAQWAHGAQAGQMTPFVPYEAEKPSHP
jgi:predicted GNAT family acetyltransferase